jgi:hypothetical protein
MTPGPGISRKIRTDRRRAERGMATMARATPDPLALALPALQKR